MRDGFQSEIKNILIVAGTVAALLVPPIGALLKVGLPSVFRFFLQDTFYYLSVAKNSSFGFYTFDGEFATSGFHPLWQVYLTQVFRLAQTADQGSLILIDFVSSVCFVTFGFVLLVLASMAMTRSRFLLILLIPGLFNLLFWGIIQFGHSPWSYMNGMESPFTVFFAGALFCLIAAHHSEPERYAASSAFHGAVGIALALLILSRLDDVFLLPGFMIALWWMSASRKDLVRRLAALTGPSCIALGVYLVFNYVTTGGFLPISGVVKGGLSLGANLDYLRQVFTLTHFSAERAPTVVQISALYRVCQLFFPAIAAMGLLVAFAKGAHKNVFLTGLLIYVILKAAYNFMNVNFNYQGVVWYFVLSVVVVNFCFVFIADKIWTERSKAAPSLRYTAPAFGLFALVYLNFVTMLPMQGRTIEYTFWSERSAIKHQLLTHIERPRIVEYDDGIINFSLGLPTIHGIGFVLDREAAEAKQKGQFLKLCVDRGYNVIASLAYLRVPAEGYSSDQLRRFLANSAYFRDQNLSDFNFHVVYIHKASGATFIAFEPTAMQPS